MPLTREMETFVRDVKEEGVFLVVLDEVDRGIRNQMGHVALAINGKTILEQNMKVAQLTMIEVLEVAPQMVTLLSYSIYAEPWLAKRGSFPPFHRCRR